MTLNTKKAQKIRTRTLFFLRTDGNSRPRIIQLLFVKSEFKCMKSFNTWPVFSINLILKRGRVFRLICEVVFLKNLI
jgi:hypothetical protein